MNGTPRWTFLRFYRWNDWFFRVRGYGLSVQPLKGHRPYFSERFGYQKAWHVLGVCVKPLSRKRITFREPKASLTKNSR